MSTEPAEPVDVRNNRESVAGARAGSTSVARASDGGAPPRDAPAAGELPTRETGGTADGNPVTGVTISPEDEAEAVAADTGPDELGQRGPATNQ
jgi:hypothetical protein